MAAPVAARRVAPMAAAALAALLPVGPLHAADSRWSGSTDGQWSNGANWDAGVPTAALRAILPSGVSTAALILPAGAQALDLIVEAAGYSLGGSSGSGLTLTSPTGNLVIDGGVGAAASLLVNTVAAITTPSATIGISGGNASNLLTLDGASVSFSVANTLNVGYDGNLNALSLKAGAGLTANNLWIGGLGSAAGNKATLENTGTSATVSSSTIVGYDGQSSTLTLKSSSSLSTPALHLGLGSGSTNNSVSVEGKDGVGGAASQLSVTNELNVGYAGTTNTLQVLADGSLSKSGAGDLTIGRDASANDNQLLVKGTLSQTGGTFNVGLNGDRNSLTVNTGGQLTTTQARIGRNSGADDNTATVSGSGSLWTLNGSLRVGDGGSGNSLTIDSGGAVTIATSANLFVGYGAGSNNTLKVTGAGSTLTATTGTSEVTVSRSTGTNNKLILSDAGHANVRSIQTGPGGTLQIGEGGAPGTLVSTATVNGNNGGLSLGGGAVVFDHNASSYSFANVLSGDLRVQQKGSGTTTLTAASSYTGKTEVLAGTLALSGASNGIAASPAIEVSSGASLDVTGVTGGFNLGGSQTLAGAGSVSGNVTAPSGSTISPGLNGGTGTLTFLNDVTLAGTLAIDVNGSLIDQLVASALQLSPGASLTFTSTAAPSGAALALATYSSLLGSFSSVTGLPAGYSLDYAWQGNQIALVRNPDAVPGPLPLAGALVAWRSGRALRRRLRGR